MSESKKENYEDPKEEELSIKRPHSFQEFYPDHFCKLVNTGLGSFGKPLRRVDLPHAVNPGVAFHLSLTARWGRIGPDALPIGTSFLVVSVSDFLRIVSWAVLLLIRIEKPTKLIELSGYRRLGGLNKSIAIIVLGAAHLLGKHVMKIGKPPGTLIRKRHLLLVLVIKLWGSSCLIWGTFVNFKALRQVNVRALVVKETVVAFASQIKGLGISSRVLEQGW